ncbi:MAG: hypothetical protein ACOX87_03170 [Chloroflexota bacterium]|jgi:hypothetical protein
MYGFGRGRGGGRGVIGRGSGIGRANAYSPSIPGYTYVGGCRCGFGPNAYYQNSAGQVVPASNLFYGTNQPAQPIAEIEQLKAEKAELERRLRDLEARLQGNT